jgi:hypothetical protein
MENSKSPPRESATAQRHRRHTSHGTQIGLYRYPVTTLKYFVLYLMDNVQLGLQWLVTHSNAVASVVALTAIAIYAYNAPGPHQHVSQTHINTNIDKSVQQMESLVLWYGYWVVLGIMSSIGLGTGLHTFVLFLGPLIAQVTTVAYHCGHLDFRIRGHDGFACSKDGSGNPNLLRIANKVKWEAFFWGLGTALGELPPYFVARAASLAGKQDDEVVSIEQLEKSDPGSLSYMDRVKLAMMHMLQKYGFVGIFLCASVRLTSHPIF